MRCDVRLRFRSARPARARVLGLACERRAVVVAFSRSSSVARRLTCAVVKVGIDICFDIDFEVDITVDRRRGGARVRLVVVLSSWILCWNGAV